MTCFCQKDNINANNIARLELSEKIDVNMCRQTGYHSNPVQNLKKNSFAFESRQNLRESHKIS